MKLSLIYVNHGTILHLIKSIKILSEVKFNFRFEIIVINNDGGNIDEIIHQFSKLNIKIFYTENNGFGAACNFGYKNSSGEYIAFVNPDLIIADNIFEKLIDFYNNVPNVGFIGSILVNEKNNPVYSFNSFPSFYWEMLQAFGFGSNKAISKSLNRDEIVRSLKPFQVDWLIGAFLFTSKKLLERLNGFDELFFLYYEDVDIQLRSNFLGLINYCIPSIRLHHFERSSVRSESGDDVYHFYMYKSKMIYYYLHFSFIKRNILRIFLLIGLLFRVLLLLPRKTFPNKRKKFRQYLFMLRYFIGTKKIVFEDKRI